MLHEIEHNWSKVNESLITGTLHLLQEEIFRLDKAIESVSWRKFDALLQLDVNGIFSSFLALGTEFSTENRFGSYFFKCFTFS